MMLKTKSRFAAITRDNIKLVYLRRSLLQQLSEDEERFANKVKGCFVRYSHQLFRVTGVKKRKLNGRFYLRLSNTKKMLCIDSLSDSDLVEEECLDLMQKVKSGLIQKPTIFELQEKASSLHRDITNHWIGRELWLLGKKITKACERREWHRLNDFLSKKNLLLGRSKQLRLLERQPIVKPDELEPITEEEDEADEPVRGAPTAAAEMDQPANVTIPPVSTGTTRGKKRQNADTRRRGNKRQATGAGTSKGPPPRDDGDDGENAVGGWMVPPPHPFFAFAVTKKSLRYSYACIEDTVIQLEFGQLLDVLLRLPEGGKEWPAFVSHDGKCLRIRGAGWKQFALENVLEAGDVCFFQWHRDSRTFTVYIYR